MDQVAILQTLMMSDPVRRSALEVVAALNLPDCWIGAGFIRDAVWSHLHNFDQTPPTGDVDVVWYDTESSRDMDRRIERQVSTAMPELSWSVKNQARMHLRNGDHPYRSAEHAMLHWPETATAVAVRLNGLNTIEVSAPLGLDDLFALRLRPTPHFSKSKMPIFFERVSSKCWTERYPKLVIERRYGF